MRVRDVTYAAVLSLMGGATAVAAETSFEKVNDQQQFVELINGKELTRPLIRLRVTPDGRIEGRGAAWDVTGQWSWRDGYFCRDLFWGGDELGYNCQEVQARDGRIKFTSDKGAGMSAEFRLK